MYFPRRFKDLRLTTKNTFEIEKCRVLCVQNNRFNMHPV